jgi:hypothetical protein
MYLSDGTGVLSIYQRNPDINLQAFDIGDTVRVAGILMQYDSEAPYLEDYELCPRVQSDLELWGMSPVATKSWSAIKGLFDE